MPLSSNFERLVEKFGNETVAEYTPRLWSLPDSFQNRVSALFLACISKQLVRLGGSPESAKLICKQIQDYPIIQTTHHITPTQGPVFNAVDMLSLAGLPEGMLYPVGACSGTAFSNTAFSGALCFSSLNWEDIFPPGSKQLALAQKSQQERTAHGTSEKRLSLIPSKYRDALVYSAEMFDTVSQKTQEMRPAFNIFSPAAGQFSSYKDWALHKQQALQRKVHGTDKVIMFDLSEAASDFLLQSLKREAEIANYLCHPEMLQQCIDRFDDPDFFLVNEPGKKSMKIGKIKASNLLEMQLGREQIAQNLENKLWCPAVHLLFWVVAHLNGIKCLGSFNQCEYLPSMLEKWTAGGSTYPKASDSVALTAGRLLDEKKNLVYSLDYFLTGQTVDGEMYRGRRMIDFWGPILQKLRMKDSTTQ